MKPSAQSNASAARHDGHAVCDDHGSVRARLEIAAVVLTGAVFLVFENVLHLKLHFLIPCTLAWTAYIVWRLARDRAQAREWGMRTDTLKRASIECFAFAGVAASGILVYRLARGWQPLPVTALVLFAVYPVWGFIQQFIVQALIAGNLEKLGAPRAAIVAVAAVLFGLAHLPDLPLVALCAVAGVGWSVLFLRTRNLWPLALSHAWLGALTYYWVLERDPWREMFPQ